MIEASRDGRSEDALKFFEDSRPHWDASLKPCTEDSIYDDYVALEQFTETVMSRSDVDDYLAQRYDTFKTSIDHFTLLML